MCEGESVGWGGWGAGAGIPPRIIAISSEQHLAADGLVDVSPASSAWGLGVDMEGPMQDGRLVRRRSMCSVISRPSLLPVRSTTAATAGALPAGGSSTALSRRSPSGLALRPLVPPTRLAGAGGRVQELAVLACLCPAPFASSSAPWALTSGAAGAASVGVGCCDCV